MTDKHDRLRGLKDLDANAIGEMTEKLFDRAGANLRRLKAANPDADETLAVMLSIRDAVNDNLPPRGPGGRPSKKDADIDAGRRFAERLRAKGDTSKNRTEFYAKARAEFAALENLTEPLSPITVKRRVKRGLKLLRAASVDTQGVHK